MIVIDGVSDRVLRALGEQVLGLVAQWATQLAMAHPPATIEAASLAVSAAQV